jgi:hypothetical protein
MHGSGVEEKSERSRAGEERHDDQYRSASDLRQQPDHRVGSPAPDRAIVETAWPLRLPVAGTGLRPLPD